MRDPGRCLPRCHRRDERGFRMDGGRRSGDTRRPRGRITCGERPFNHGVYVHRDTDWRVARVLAHVRQSYRREHRGARLWFTKHHAQVRGKERSADDARSPRLIAWTPRDFAQGGAHGGISTCMRDFRMKPGVHHDARGSGRNDAVIWGSALALTVFETHHDMAFIQERSDSLERSLGAENLRDPHNERNSILSSPSCSRLTARRALMRGMTRRISFARLNATAASIRPWLT